jgi:hypothetical protein
VNTVVSFSGAPGRIPLLKNFASGSQVRFDKRMMAIGLDSGRAITLQKLIDVAVAYWAELKERATKTI